MNVSENLQFIILFQRTKKKFGITIFVKAKKIKEHILLAPAPKTVNFYFYAHFHSQNWLRPCAKFKSNFSKFFLDLGCYNNLAQLAKCPIFSL